MHQSGNIVQKLAVLYLIVWTIAPPLGIDMIYRLLAMGCVGVWTIFALKAGYKMEHIHVYAVFFALYVAVIAYVEKGNINGVLQQIGIYMLVISFLINGFYKENRWHELRAIVPVILILLIVFNNRTAQMLIEDPGVARRIVRSDEATYAYMRNGIGGYGLIYPQVCVSPAIFAWIKSAFRKNKICFGIGCIWAVTFVEYLMSAGYSIAIFTTVVGVIMAFFYKGKNLGGAIFVTLGILVGFLGALIYVDGFREFLLQTFDGTEVVTKINDLVTTSETGIAEDSIYARIKAYKGSINTLLQYPIIGSLWNASGGGHSAILDAFAKYGIWGGTMYTRMIFYVPIFYKKKYPHSLIHRVANAVIVSTLLVALFDSFPFNFMCMILLVVPLLIEDIIRWEGI